MAMPSLPDPDDDGVFGSDVIAIMSVGKVRLIGKSI